MNSKGLIGETMTWIIATIVIVVILGISIFVTSILGVAVFPKEYKLEKTSDLIAVKSLSGYLLTLDLEGSGKNIFEKFKEDEEFKEMNGVNGKLASQIFNNFYDKDYRVIWLGVVSKMPGWKVNEYFGSYSETWAWELERDRMCLSKAIFLIGDNKWVQLLLC